MMLVSIMASHNRVLRLMGNSFVFVRSSCCHKAERSDFPEQRVFLPQVFQPGR